MRTTPRPTARIVWEEGMHLAPHHFQAQRRHHEESLARAAAALFPFGWGLTAVELDVDALRNGTAALLQARGILPDGTPVQLPDAAPLPAPRALAEAFAPTRDAQVLCLALPAWRTDAPNVAGLEDGNGSADAWQAMAPGAEPRFRALSRTVVDETTGGDALPLRFAAPNFRLLLDNELAPDDFALPLARLRRDGAGHFVLDEGFVPPCLHLAASPRLLGLLRGAIDMLDAKGAALAATLAAAAPAPAGAAPGGGPAAYVGSELATRWLLHAVRSAEAPLRHLMAVRAVHPERLWTELARLAGALCTFSLTAQARDLPAYDHDDLGGCFAALEAHLRTHLDVVVAARATVIPLARVSDVLHAGAVPDPRCHAPGARWFLGVRSSAGAAAASTLVPQLAKVCASRFVPELVRRAHPGLPLAHLPAPPPAIAPRPELTYFELTLAEPCAGLMRRELDVGVYVPEALGEAALEVVVLLPAG